MTRDSFRGYPVGVAGERYRQDAVARCRAGQIVALLHEPDNIHDDRAIRVISQSGEHIGYVPRGNWVARAMIDEGRRPHARIHRIEGDFPELNVVLDVEIDEVDDRPEYPLDEEQSNEPNDISRTIAEWIAYAVGVAFLLVTAAWLL